MGSEMCIRDSLEGVGRLDDGIGGLRYEHDATGVRIVGIRRPELGLDLLYPDYESGLAAILKAEIEG